MRLERIWIKRAHRGPMDAVASARVVAGEGLAGNADLGGSRQLTLLSAERWRAALLALGAELDPSARRANLLVSGIELEGARRRVLQVGSVRLEIRGENPPCHVMDEMLAGLQAALRPHWGAGVYARALDSGEIRVGDPLGWQDGR
jgi:MOSC domain-containing protein YiiM